MHQSGNAELLLKNYSGRKLLRVGRLVWLWESEATLQEDRPQLRRGRKRRLALRALLWLRRRRRRKRSLLHDAHWEQEHYERKNALRVYPGGYSTPEAALYGYLLLRRRERERQERND